MLSNNFFCFWVILIFVFSPKLGAQALTQTESDFFDEAAVILTASRMSKPLAESPASVSVIDRQMIESSGVRELADIFRLVPGMIVGNYSGDRPVVTYHGLGNAFSRQIQVLIDGRSVFIPSFGGVPWANLPLQLEDVERIEVIRGPNAVTYGANAFLATINIITRHSAEDLGARYSVTTSGNSNPDIGDAYFRLGYHFDDLDWRLSLGTLNDDGFESVNDSRETNKMNFRLDYLADRNSFWTFQFGVSNTRGGRGEPDNETNIERDEDANNHYFNINWERVSDTSTTTIRLTRTEQDVSDNFTPEPITIGGIPGVSTFINFDRDSNRTDVEIIQTEELGPTLRGVYGASLRQDQVKSIFLFNDNRFHDIDTSRLFTSLEWRFAENWMLDLGTTLEDSSLTEAAYSPRVSLLRQLNSNHVMRFVASRARRNPVLYEHSGLSVFSANATIPPIGNVDIDIKTAEGNPEIVPEDLISYEIGLRSQYRPYAIASDIKIFTYTITDLVTDSSFEETHPLLDSVKVATFVNDQEVDVNGIEVSFDISPVEDLEIKSGMSFISADAEDPDLEASFPDTAAFVVTQYNWQPRHSLTASLYYIGEMTWPDAPHSPDPEIPAIRKLDMRYSYLIDEASETRVDVVGHNLLDEYDDYIPGQLNERVYWLRISGGF